MNDINMIVVALSSLVGGALSLAFMIFPKLKTWYDSKTKRERGLWMFSFVLIGSVVVWFIGCYELFPGFVTLTCNQEGFTTLIVAIFTTASSNQAVHRMTKDYFANDEPTEEEPQS